MIEAHPVVCPITSSVVPEAIYKSKFMVSPFRQLQIALDPLKDKTPGPPDKYTENDLTITLFVKAGKLLGLAVNGI